MLSGLPSTVVGTATGTEAEEITTAPVGAGTTAGIDSGTAEPGDGGGEGGLMRGGLFLPASSACEGTGVDGSVVAKVELTERPLGPVGAEEVLLLRFGNPVGSRGTRKGCSSSVDSSSSAAMATIS